MANFKTSFFNCCAADGAAINVVYGRHLSFSPKWHNADFGSAQEKVAKAEGGYQSDPDDNGNWTGGKKNSGVLIGTKYGVSAPVLKEYLGRTPTVDEMKNLSYATAVSIYRVNYWNPIGGDKINSQRVADIIYDAAVNSGVSTAKKFVTDSLKTTTYSVDKINAANESSLFNSIGAFREAFYIRIGGKYLEGWLARLKSLGYSGVAYAKGHIVNAILFAIGFGALVTGIILLTNKK